MGASPNRLFSGPPSLLMTPALLAFPVGPQALPLPTPPGAALHTFRPTPSNPSCSPQRLLIQSAGLGFTGMGTLRKLCWQPGLPRVWGLLDLAASPRERGILRATPPQVLVVRYSPTHVGAETFHWAKAPGTGRHSISGDPCRA